MKLGKYKHYKGNFDEVVGVARYFANRNQEFVVYKALHQGDFPENQLWIRPKQMFQETLEKNGQVFKRFEPVG